jgi:hypothetical protein
LQTLDGDGGLGLINCEDNPLRSMEILILCGAGVCNHASHTGSSGCLHSTNTSALFEALNGKEGRNEGGILSVASNSLGAAFLNVKALHKLNTYFHRLKDAQQWVLAAKEASIALQYI